MIVLVVLEQIGLYLPMIMGAYISLVLMKIPSLSIESAYVAGAITSSFVILMDGSNDVSLLIMALIAAFFGGAMVGVLAGLFSQKANFSHLLSAIVSIGFFHGLFQFLLQGSHIALPAASNALRLFIITPRFPELFLIMLIAGSLLCVVIWFLKTEFATSCALYGDNLNFLKSYRINQAYVVIVGLAISNGLVGISGYLVAQSMGFVDTSMGSGTPLFCISSLIIGKALCFKVRKLIFVGIPIFGLLGYMLIQVGLLKMGFELRYFTAVQALIVAILLVYLSKIRTGVSYQDSLGL